MKDIENDEFVEVSISEQEKKRWQVAAKYTLEKLKKDKRVTIRVDKNDLAKIQNKAVEKGIPYQTIIASLLHQYAEEKIKVSL
ncbi:hypothetical protein HY357_03625 [Candidatus Roizmanbacteria bacterium]|nr:hypothetical protein [Candidatus Roizmanbacteria bacterium]